MEKGSGTSPGVKTEGGPWPRHTYVIRRRMQECSKQHRYNTRNLELAQMLLKWISGFFFHAMKCYIAMKMAESQLHTAVWTNLKCDTE